MTEPLFPPADRTPLHPGGLVQLPGVEVSAIEARPPRIVVFNRWASAVALTLGIILMAATLITTVWIAATLGNISDRLNTDTTTPGPIVSGCPFGDDQCGG